MTTEINSLHGLLIIGFTIDTGSISEEDLPIFPVLEGGADEVGERNIKFNGGRMDTENLLVPKL